MQVKYRISLEDHVKLYSLRFQHDPDLKELKWFFRILSFLIFQCIISTLILIMTFIGDENISPPIFFLSCNVIFIAILPYGSRKISKFHIVTNLKEIDLNCDRTLDVQESDLIFKSNEVKIVFPWSNFKTIEQLDKFILLKFKTLAPIAVPQKAFDSQQEADDFIKLVRNYNQNAEQTCKSTSVHMDDSKEQRKPFSTKALLVLIIGVVFIFMLNIWISSGGKHNSWTHVFNNGDPQALYQETTNGFKSRISQEQWNRLVGEWRERLGSWQKTKVLSFDSFSGDEFPDKLTKPSSHFNTVQKLKLKIIGNNGVVHITSYRYLTEGVWRLNSFEIVFEVKNTESYLIQEDIKFVEEND